MNSSTQPSNVSLIEKQYLYRNAWSQTFTVVVASGFGTWIMARLALSKDLPLLWFFALLFLITFGLGIWIILVNIQGKMRFMISRNGIHVPLLWNSQNHTFVPFSEINNVELMQVYGNTIFEVSAGRKKYPITKSWFPTQGDFEEVVDTIMARLPDHLRYRVE